MSLLKCAEKQGSQYQNPVPVRIGGPGLFFKVLPLYWSNRAETEPKQPLGPFTTEASVYQRAPESGLRLTWFGHSASLVEIDGVRLLIDPVWEQRASPVQWLGPKRFYPPTLRLEDLPELDAVLISHDHYDHLGAGTMKRLAGLNATARARWITSAGVARHLRRFGVAGDRITELDWTQSTEVAGAEFGTQVRVMALPARHFSGRTPWDRFKSLWSSFVIHGPRHRVYFGADSGLWPGFAEIAMHFGPFDLTMLEIGAFHPLWADIHLGPDGAAEAFRMMGGPERAGLLMPIHWGLFNLALHGWREPIERLDEIASGEGWPLWTPEPGVPTEVWPQQPIRSGWWRRSR